MMNFSVIIFYNGKITMHKGAYCYEKAVAIFNEAVETKPYDTITLMNCYGRVLEELTV